MCCVAFMPSHSYANCKERKRKTFRFLFLPSIAIELFAILFFLTVFSRRAAEEEVCKSLSLQLKLAENKGSGAAKTK